VGIDEVSNFFNISFKNKLQNKLLVIQALIMVDYTEFSSLIIIEFSLLCLWIFSIKLW